MKNVNVLIFEDFEKEKEKMKNAYLMYHGSLPSKVIFHEPATIVYWNDGTKTVVKAVNEPFDKEKGLAMAISKKHFGNKSYYYKIFKKFIEEVDNDKQKETL